MSMNKVSQIIINGRYVGISGLEEAIRKIAPIKNNLSEDEIEKKLLDLISADNYIPPGATDIYGKSVLREFHRASGLPVEPENIPGLRIAVLGMGCARCTQLESDVRDTLSEMKMAADLSHINDVKEIAGYGVLGSPALVINGKVVAVGEVPPKSKIRQWIIEAYSTENMKQ